MGVLRTRERLDKDLDDLRALLPEQRQITNPSSDPTQLANSYLFSGPVNVINEGGPVPIGYGRLIVGSQVIMSTYGTTKVLIREAGRVR